MRTKKSIYNFISDVIPYLILAVLNFLRIKYLIKYYGEDTNGYMQLVTQIFSYLSLAEAGFGTAVIYKLYKPLADNDHDKISSIVVGSKIIFKKIALIMTAGSVLCSIAIPLFVNKGSLTSLFLVSIFLFYSVHFLIEYFIVYPYTSLLQADQNQYVFNAYKNIIKILFGALELFLMSLKFNLLLIISINILFTFVYIHIVKRKVKKLYPWLNEKAKPDTTAFGMTKDVLVHKLSYLVFSKTDPIILSAFSLGYVSLYTSYNYILDFITNIVSKLYNSIRASYCNIVALGKTEDKKYFDMFLSFSFFVACFCCMTFFSTANHFVDGIWLNKNYNLNKSILLLFSITTFAKIINNPIYIARDSKGLYKETKMFTIVQAIVNIVLSLLLVKKCGMFGVLLATAIAQYTISIPCNVKIVYNKVFNTNIIEYLKKLCFSTLNCVILYFINGSILNMFNLTNKYQIILFMLVIALVNLVETTFVYYFLDNDFKTLFNGLIFKLKKKVKNNA